MVLANTIYTTLVPFIRLLLVTQNSSNHPLSNQRLKELKEQGRIDEGEDTENKTYGSLVVSR